MFCSRQRLNFYPRSPCGERRWPRGMIPLCLYFYPRSPCGERLFGNEAMGAGNNNFYPRSPCGERRSGHPETRPSYAISIHALLAESDHFSFYSQQGHFPFLSTLSLRRATVSNQRVSSDFWDFYPRSPCGERLGRAFWPGLSL